MVEHQMIYSPKEKKNNGHITNITSQLFRVIQLLMVAIFSLCWPLIILHHVQNGSSFISSHVFPHLFWVPTDSFPQSKAGSAPHPPLPVDQFQEALDPGNWRNHFRQKNLVLLSP